MKNVLLLILILLAVTGCVGSKEADIGIDGSGKTSNQSPDYTLKIVGQFTGSLITSAALSISDTISVKTVISDSSGFILEEVPSNWSVTGSLRVSDLSSQSAIVTSLTGGAAGSGFITAVVTDATILSKYNLKSSVTSTGLITILASVVPNEVTKISGDTQTGQVGTVLGQTLKVRVFDIGSTPIVGADVTFTAPVGGGVIVSAQPVATDANGYAECIVRVGGVAGTATNTYHATIASGATTTVSFTANSTAGIPAGLSMGTQPDGGNINAALNIQPVIKIVDSYGNLVTTAINDVTVAVTSGAGATTGTLTITAVSGLATFLNLIHDTVETGVRYTFSSPGLTSIASAPFDIGQIHINAQCASEGAGWQTREGGCKDLSSGLVWSGVSTTDMSWHQAVWTQATAGSSLQDAQDEGRITDNDSSQATITDVSSVGYCHDLVESGYSDWVLPTFTQFTDARSNSAATKLKEVDMSGAAFAGWMFSSTPINGSNSHMFENGGITANNWPAINLTRIRCVRFPAATQLLVSQQVSATEYNALGVIKKNLAPMRVWEIQPKVQIRDSSSSIRSISTKTVTVSLATGTGTLGGTLTVAAVNGVASFTNLYYDTAETITLRFTSPGLTDAISSPIIIHPKLPQAECQIAAGEWTPADGGCKHKSTGLIFGTVSLNAMTWHGAVWDQAAPSAAAADAYDNGRTDDYDNSPGAVPDNAGLAYCHDLNESSMQDWFLPTTSNFVATSASNAHTNTNIIKDIYFYTATTLTGNPSYADLYYLVSGTGVMSGTNILKTSSYKVLCARRDPPTALQFQTTPSGLGAGIAWSTQPVVKLVDVDGSPAPIAGVTVTMTLSQGSGSLLNNYNEVSTMVATTDSNGYATFSNVSYSVPNENIKLTFTASTFTHDGVNTTIPPFESANLSIPTTFAASRCLSEAIGTWETREGGCRDMNDAFGLVWSHSLDGGVSWNTAAWDSTVGGSQAADADDGALLNDYDPASPALSSNFANSANSCHKIKLNGFKDWRMATVTEMETLKPSVYNGKDFVNTAATAGAYIWSSTRGNSDANAMMMTASGVWDWYSGTAGYLKSYTGAKVLCVREP